MIEESIEDFRKRYKGTFVFLSVDSRKHLARYDTDNEEDFAFYSPTYGDILVDKQTARSSIEFHFPESGLYNINNGVHEFVRYPARQWKRAPCEENTKFYNLLYNIGLRASTTFLDISTADQLFFPKYPASLDEAIKNLKTITALSTKFAVSFSPDSGPEKLLLWYKQQPIGYIHPNLKSIEIKYKPLFQEAVDFVKKKEYTWQLMLSN